MLPSCRCASITEVVSKPPWMRPASMSVMSVEAPLYGTTWMSAPVCILNISASMCGGAPLGTPKLSVPGLALA